MYHFVQYRPDKREQWHMVAVNQPLKALPAFRTVLGVSADPEAFIDQGIEPLDHIKFLGPMYFDLDGEDINEVLNQARILVAELEGYGVDANLLSLYLSGKKGVHITLPEVMFGVTQAVHYLPLIWEKFAAKFSGSCIDRGVYSSGKGRMWRCTQVQRPDTGTFKVQITNQELQTMTLADYNSLVSSPRPDLRIDEALLQPVPRLVSEFQAIQPLVKAEVRAKKLAVESITEEYLHEIEGVPGCIEILITEGDGPESNWNQAAMQLAGYIGAKYNKDDDLAVYTKELIEPFLENVQSSSRNEKERRQAMQDLLYRAFNGRIKFYFGGVVHTIGRVCGSCELCTRSQKEREIEDGEFFDDLTKIKLAKNRVYSIGETTARNVLNVGIQQITNFKELDEFKQLTDTHGHYMVTSPTGERKKVTIEESDFYDRRKFLAALGGGGVVYSGNDIDLQCVGSALHRYRFEREVDEMIQTRTSGIIFYEDPRTGETYPQLVASNGCFAKGGAPSKFIYIGNEKLSPDFRKVPDFETEEDLEKAMLALKSMFSMNEVSVTVPAIGWTIACMIKTHITSGADPTFPLLSLAGTSESGKSSTAFLLLTLNGFPYRRAPFWNAEVDTMYPLEEMVSTTSTFIRMIDEANEHNAKRNWPRLVGLLKSNWDAGDIMKGGLSGKGVVTTHVPNTAPLMYLSEQAFPVQSIRTRSVECNFTGRAMESAEFQKHFKAAEKSHFQLHQFAKVLATAALNLSISDVERWLEEAEELVPERYSGRTRRAYTVVFTGLRFLEFVLEKYEAPLLEFALAKKQEYIKVLSDIAEDTLKSKRRSAVDEALEDFETMAIERHDPAHGLLPGIHYYRTGKGYDSDIIALDLRQIFPRWRRYARGIEKKLSIANQNQLKYLLQGQSYYRGTAKHEMKGGVEMTLIDLNVLAQRGMHLTEFENGGPRND